MRKLIPTNKPNIFECIINNITYKVAPNGNAWAAYDPKNILVASGNTAQEAADNI